MQSVKRKGAVTSFESGLKKKDIKIAFAKEMRTWAIELKDRSKSSEKHLKVLFKGFRPNILHYALMVKLFINQPLRVFSATADHAHYNDFKGHQLHVKVLQRQVNSNVLPSGFYNRNRQWKTKRPAQIHSFQNTL